jgi:hypothetical protein
VPATTTTFAQECNRDFYVASQDDLTSISRNCSILDGTIYINGTYNGSFILSGITSITRSLRVAWWDDAPTPQISNMELRDLQYVRVIELTSLTASNFLAPKLESVVTLRLGQEKLGSEALLPSLRSGGLMSIVGNYSRYRVVNIPCIASLQRTRVVLDSLERVNDSLAICTMPYCDESMGKSIIDSPLNVTLPSLVTANRVAIASKASM